MADRNERDKRDERNKRDSRQDNDSPAEDEGLSPGSAAIIHEAEEAIEDSRRSNSILRKLFL